MYQNVFVTLLMYFIFNLRPPDFHTYKNNKSMSFNFFHFHVFAVRICEVIAITKMTELFEIIKNLLPGESCNVYMFIAQNSSPSLKVTTSRRNAGKRLQVWDNSELVAPLQNVNKPNSNMFMSFPQNFSVRMFFFYFYQEAIAFDS